MRLMNLLSTVDAFASMRIQYSRSLTAVGGEPGDRTKPESQSPLARRPDLNTIRARRGNPLEGE